MSECNKCRLAIIKANAEKAGNKVSIFDAPGMPGNGINIHVHPRSVKIKREDGESMEEQPWFVAWYMDIGNECECD